ncbi:MAG: hypothetical protein AAB407_01420 [Patescibacteria group bacterium]
MSIEILRYIVPLILIVASYWAWKKYQDKDYLWLGIVAGISFILKTIDLIIETIFESSAKILMTESIVSMIALVILILFVLKIAFRNFRKK